MLKQLIKLTRHVSLTRRKVEGKRRKEGGKREFPRVWNFLGGPEYKFQWKRDNRETRTIFNSLPVFFSLWAWIFSPLLWRHVSIASLAVPENGFSTCLQYCHVASPLQNETNFGLVCWNILTRDKLLRKNVNPISWQVGIPELLWRGNLQLRFLMRLKIEDSLKPRQKNLKPQPQLEKLWYPRFGPQKHNFDWIYGSDGDPRRDKILQDPKKIKKGYSELKEGYAGKGSLLATRLFQNSYHKCHETIPGLVWIGYFEPHITYMCRNIPMYLDRILCR